MGGWRRWVVFGGAIVSVVGTWTSPIGAQSRVIRDRDPCADCLEVAHVAALRPGPTDGFISSSALAITGLRDGRYAVMEPTDAARIKLYSPDGRFEDAVGKEGQGPGEFSQIAGLAATPNGRFLAYDPGNGRLTEMEPDWSYVGQLLVPVQIINFVVVRDGRLAINGLGSSPTGGLRLLHLFDDGELTSIDSGVGRIDLRGGFGPAIRYMAAAQGEGFWSIPQLEMQLTEHDANGAPLRTLSRVADWFPPQHEARFRKVGDRDPPTPRVAALSVDEQGLVWVFALVAAPDWEDRLAAGSGDTVDGFLQFNTRIEVIDPDMGQLVAAMTFDGAISGLVRNRDDLFFVLRNDERGERAVDLYRFTISR